MPLSTFYQKTICPSITFYEHFLINSFVIAPYLQISPHFAVETTAAVCENRTYGTLAREKCGLIPSDWRNFISFEGLYK
jgi:hypothetical protein